MNYFLLSVSMLSMILQNSIHNGIGINMLKTDKDIYRFNELTYIVCIILFLFMALGGPMSLYSLGMGVLFGIFTLLSNAYKVKALSLGPMHITILITTSSMIIPALSGVVLFGEAISISKITAMAMLIGFIFLSVGEKKDNNSKINKKWILSCLITFFSMGAIGVMQKIHQSSPHKYELFGFLCCSFALSFIYAFFASRKSMLSIKKNTRVLLLVVISGICTFAMNLLNLKLSGIIPSQIFFPTVNGGSIILSSICSVVIFKEKITKRQLIGLLGGLLSLIAICVL
ncbi:MAG: EamA family transporter [Clostridia bacterium]|nr:EamA family transporter [Clostridia bacterium]